MAIQPAQFSTYSLSQSPRGDDICRILAAAIQSADAQLAIRKHTSLEGDHLVVDEKSYDLAKYQHIFLIAIGKAAAPMAVSMHEMLADRITAGIVVTKQGYLGEIRHFDGSRISVFAASHPVPDHANLDTSSKVNALIQEVKPDDLVICLLSGGGSALLSRPAPGIALADLQITTEILLACGANIGEFNAVRKHLDDFKGGKLAKLVAPATVISLILSDVVGDALDQVASGPTAADPTTYQDCWSILNRYQLLDRIPVAIRIYLQEGIDGKHPETVKPRDLVLAHVQNVMIGSNSQAIQAAERAALTLGFSTRLLTTTLQGEASQAGLSLVESVKSILASPVPPASPVCFLAGGETTVTIHGSGLGGRNQELALGAVENIGGDIPLILVSLATDGGDGPSDAAGAVATHHTFQRGLSLGIDPQLFLAQNDAYHYFERLGDLIKIGPTFTNINDLVFIFAL